MVKLIAMQEIKINGKTWGPMPEGSKGRHHAYIFELPVEAAAALVRKGRCRPAFAFDEKMLTKAGVTCRSMLGKAPKAGSQPAPEPAQERESGLDMSAVLSGTKSEMKAACEMLGLDTDGTKAELKARLEGAM